MWTIISLETINVAWVTCGCRYVVVLFCLLFVCCCCFAGQGPAHGGLAETS